MKNNIGLYSGVLFCSGSYHVPAITGSCPPIEDKEPERLATSVLDQIRRWLKEGNSIRAEEPNSDILNLKSENSVYDGLVIEGPGRRG